MIVDDLWRIANDMQMTIVFVTFASICALSFLYIKYKNGIILRIGLSIAIIASYSALIVDFFNYSRPVTGNLYEFWIIVAVLLGVVLVGLVGYYLHSTVIKPINNLVSYSKELSEGNLSVTFDNQWNRKDEIFELNQAYTKTISTLTTLMKDIVNVISDLTNSSMSMSSSSQELNASSEEITAITQKISSGAQEQSEKIKETKMHTIDLARLFNEKFQELQNTARIVENITSQVNMLALNASIESARAGEYGRGFAVVADNIRQLADDTKNSLQGINDIIMDIESTLSNSINVISSSIESILKITDEAVSGSEMAFAASEEQSASMQELSSIAQELTTYSLRLKERTTMFTF